MRPVSFRKAGSMRLGRAKLAVAMTIAGLTAAMAATPSSMAEIAPTTSSSVPAGETRPVDSGAARPVTLSEHRAARKASAAAVESGIGVGAPEHPFLTAMSAQEFSDVKDAAATRDSGEVTSPEVTSPDGERSTAGVPTTRTPAVTTSFLGLDRAEAASDLFRFDPSDATAAKSDTHVLEATNSALRLFTDDGTAVQTMDLNTFFGAGHDFLANGGLDLLFDPRVYFDRNSVNQRIYVAAIQAYGNSSANGVSRLWVGVSRSSDPGSLGASDWCTYGIDAKRDNGTSKASYMDFPSLGVGRDSLLVSGNQFRFTNGSYTYPVVYVFNKNKMANNAGGGCPNVPFWVFQPTSTLGSTTTFTLQPVRAYNATRSYRGTKNPAYLVSSDTPAGTSPTIHVWRIRNVTGGAPTMALKNVAGPFRYRIPPDAEQPDGTGVVANTGDTRVHAAAGRDNTIHAVLTTGCQVDTGPSESCMLYTKINVGQTKKRGNLTASITEQWAWGERDGVFIYRPSVAVNQSSQVAAAALVTSADAADPEAGYEGPVWYLKNSGALKWTTSVFQPGNCPLPDDRDDDSATDDGVARTGDFTSVQTDPSDGLSFWYAGEFAKTIGSSCQWGSQITRITP